MIFNALIRASLCLGVPFICCDIASAQPLPPIPPIPKSENLPPIAAVRSLTFDTSGRNLPPIPAVRSRVPIPKFPKIQNLPAVQSPPNTAPNAALPNTQAGVEKSFTLPPIPKIRKSGAGQAVPIPQPSSAQVASPAAVAASAVAPAPEAPAAAPVASAPSSSPASGPIISGSPKTTSSHSRREITIYADTSVGFDRQSLVDTPTGPLTIDNRFISRLTLTGEYPLSNRTDVSLGVPYVYQTARATSAEGTLRRKGQGIGDMDFYISHRFPSLAGGLRFSAGAGVVLPTGKAFHLNDNQLRTGSGFYQPYVHLSVRKMMVPLQFYVSADYGTSIARRVDGDRANLPNSYGGEVGFYYALGPQFSSRSGLSYGKTNSPFIGTSGSTTAYLRQALSYQTNNQTSITASLDAGLTDDSTDAYFQLSAISTF